MKDAVAGDSVIARVTLRSIVTVKTALTKTDELLSVVNRHSIIYNMVKPAAHGICGGFDRIYSDAVMVKGACNIVSRCLRRMLKSAKVFLCGVYRGSFVMNFFGRVASGSVWAR